jgi:D-arabinose 1-dehydrogenase-like Zn-dependent alcohol dehydrogenase
MAACPEGVRRGPRRRAHPFDDIGKAYARVEQGQVRFRAVVTL